MDPKLTIRGCVIICSYLLAMLSGRDALSCCRRDFTNGSSCCELSDPPDTSCGTQWSADGIVVVDESGGVDRSRVHHEGPQSIILRGQHTDVIFWMDCAPPKNSVQVYCNDLCRSSRGQSHNAANRSTSDGIFILLLIIIIIFICVT